jgi:N-hydroxyarylamine O-acetyltransferase
MDLDAYLARIGYTGSLEPNHDTLTALLQAHMTTIPFENLDVLLGRGVRLDLDSLQAKLVTARRGGYCYEHATLFQAVLEQVGFRTSAHAARVILMSPRTQSPRTHMFLTVATPEGRFMVDPGFGGHAPRLPIELQDGAEVRVENDTHRLVRDEWGWMLRVQTGDKSIDAWVSTLEAENPIDFELANHFTSTHPKSPFTSRLMMRAFAKGTRVGVMNRDVTIGGETLQLADRQALRGLLREWFGFDLAEVTELRIPSVPEWQ